MDQAHLGEALYASFDGEFVWLRTSNGALTTNEVVLELAAVEKLLDFIKTLAKPEQREAASSVHRAAAPAPGSTTVGHALQ